MSNREQIIERIKKLLSHSVENGATEAEAVAFALKAQKLIADNDVETLHWNEQQAQDLHHFHRLRMRRQGSVDGVRASLRSRQQTR